jgi:hypothetical protein
MIRPPQLHAVLDDIRLDTGRYASPAAAMGIFSRKQAAKAFEPSLFKTAPTAAPPVHAGC